MPKIGAETLEQHRTEILDRLLDAWGELVMANGFDAVTLADVAAHTGLARTAIYHWFADREALLFAWTEREVQKTINALQAELATVTSAAEQLKIFINYQLVEFGRSHLPPGKEVVQFLKPESYERFMEHIEPLDKVLRSIIESGLRRREFADIDPEDAVRMVMACIGAERVPLSTGSVAVDESARRVTSFVLRALQ